MTFQGNLMAAPSWGKKSDNTRVARQAKITIRRNVLDAIGADNASVFDAFAGEGHMHRAVWHDAARYVGCDLRFFTDDRPAFVGDNRRVLRCLDLAAFNIFDLDSYGSPMEQAYIIAKRRQQRPGERLGLVLTEGEGLKLKFGDMSNALAVVTGLDPRSMSGLAKGQDWLIQRAIDRLAEMLSATVVKRWQAVGVVGSRMYYIGLVLEAKTPGNAEVFLPIEAPS